MNNEQTYIAFNALPTAICDSLDCNLRRHITAVKTVLSEARTTVCVSCTLNTEDLKRLVACKFFRSIRVGGMGDLVIEYAR